MNYRGFTLCVLIVTGALIALLSNENVAPDNLNIPFTYENYNDLNQTQTQQPITLVDNTILWEINAQHTQTSKGITAASESLSAGVCVFDANNDGWMDMFVVGGSGFSRHYGRASWWSEAEGNRLLVNDRGLRFVDKTRDSGLDPHQWGTACAIEDLDLDGKKEILVTGYEKNVLYTQIDDFKFKNITVEAGIQSDTWSTSAILGDYDNDGLTDIYITNLVKFIKGKRTFEQDSGFEAPTAESFSPRLYDPEPNRLYRNLGNLKFESVEKSLNVENAFGRSLTARWHDMNEDNWLDLIVLNDFDSPNQIYINQQGKHFSLATAPYSNFHLPGTRDFAVIHGNETQYFLSRGQGKPNVFFTMNEQKNAFVDSARESGIAESDTLMQMHWGVAIADLDNNGLDDIYQVSGSLIPDQESMFVSQRQPNNILMQYSSGNFTETSESLHNIHFSSRAVATADFDNDGTLEVIVANNNGPVQILGSNSVGNSWIGLDIKSLALSAKKNQPFNEVKISSGQYSKVIPFSSTQSLFAQSDHRFHTGLGKGIESVDIKIIWRDGSETRVEGLDTNQYYRFETASLNPIKLEKAATSSHLTRLISEAKEEEIPFLAELVIHTKDKLAVQSIWNVASPRNKVKIIQKALRAPTPFTQFWLFSGLNDGSNDVVVAAINAFKKLEWDHSVMRLLPLFEHNDENVVCAIANTFMFFFDEEEAVPERKYLAISPIIKALEKADEKKSVCLLNALAASESKRAVLAINDKLQTSTNTIEQSAAIRAFGLIRDSRASKMIKEWMTPKIEIEPLAAALIALRRLQDKDFLPLYQKTLSPTDSPEELVKQLKVLSALILSKDGIVIGKGQLIDSMLNLVNAALMHPKHEILTHTVKAAMTVTKGERFALYVDHLVDTETRQTSDLLTMISVGDLNTKKRAENILASLDADSMIEIWTQMDSLQLPVSPRIMEILVNRLSNEEGLLDKLLDTANHVSQETMAKFVKNALNGLSNIDQIGRVLETAAAHNTPLKLKPTEFNWLDNNLLAAIFLEWQYRLTSQSNHQQLSYRLLLNRVLTDSKIKESTKLNLLRVAAENDVFVAENYLLHKSTAFSKDTITLILAELAIKETEMREECNAYLQQALEDSNSSAITKYAAAAALLKGNSKRQIEIMANL